MYKHKQAHEFSYCNNDISFFSYFLFVAINVSNKCGRYFQDHDIWYLGEMNLFYAVCLRSLLYMGVNLHKDDGDSLLYVGGTVQSY